MWIAHVKCRVATASRPGCFRKLGERDEKRRDTVAPEPVGLRVTHQAPHEASHEGRS